MTRIILAAVISLLSSICLARPPGGGNGTGPDVTAKDEGQTIVLDNGIVAIRIDKKSATIETFNYRGLNLFEGGHGGGKMYFSWNAPAFGAPLGTTTLTADPSANHGDYAEVKVHSPWSGKTRAAAMDVDIYYSLKRGAHGYYVTAMLNHPASYPRTELGEWRSNAYVSPIFDWLSVDAKRQRKMPTVEDMANAVSVQGAPKEVTLLTSGEHAGQFECKYSYSADLGDLEVWGWSSTSKRVGIWMTIPSHEYYNGGPKKRELTVHMDHTLLNMLNGSHYGMGGPLVMQAGEPFQKTFGPYFIYANSYQGSAADPESKVVEALWQDAQAQAAAEQSAWPYTWFKNANYVQESGRGTVSGTLKVSDSGNPSATGAGAWIGLAPDDMGLDFQMQGRTYQFWVRAGSDGKFTIPHVLPGSYHLWAFGAGNIGTFKSSLLDVRAGQDLNLHTVTWSPSRVANTVWEIGIPDRDTHEYRDGEFNYTQWATYAKNLSQTEGLVYTVGVSDWHKDWNYALFGSAPWTVNFSLTNTPPDTAAASLYIAFASSDPALVITLNGTRLGTYNTPYPGGHAPVRLGSHSAFSDVRLPIPPGVLRQGQNSLSIMQILKSGKHSTTQFDYLRLEAAGTGLATP